MIPINHATSYLNTQRVVLVRPVFPSMNILPDRSHHSFVGFLGLVLSLVLHVLRPSYFDVSRSSITSSGTQKFNCPIIVIYLHAFVLTAVIERASLSEEGLVELLLQEDASWFLVEDHFVKKNTHNYAAAIFRNG